MSRATLVLKTRETFAGGVIEIVVWAFPEPPPPSAHRFKYRLVFVRDGARLVRCDNERGKGDHRHVGGRELSYAFAGVSALVADFRRDVEAAK